MTALLTHLAEGDFRTANQVVRWLQEKHGVEMTVGEAYQTIISR
jgi:hypothetical protein